MTVCITAAAGLVGLCGINGFNFTNPGLAQSMNRAIKYRGPDDDGTFSDTHVSLGAVRLSIIDLSKAGSQPMLYSHGDKTAVIVFNGEIYNCNELRHWLESIGFGFKSHSDTEVVVASYLASGTDCVKNFNGMWAFAIYDPAKQSIFCSRDRMGKKPLYYYYNDGKFVFSSEIRGLLVHEDLHLNRIANISPDAINLYFTFGFIPAPHAIYKNTFKLEARQNLILDLTTQRVRRWYYYALPRYDPTYNRGSLIQEGRALIEDAVRLRMFADVPVGVFLSGGIDSCTIVSYACKFTDPQSLHTFSVGFEGRRYDETPFIKIAAERFGTNHHHYIFRERDFEQRLSEYGTVFDEPLADLACFPTHLLCEKAREKVTVALSGDGGDEIFAGYSEHVAGYRMDLIKKIPRYLRGVLSKMPARRNLDGYVSIFLLKKAFQASLRDPALFYARALEGEIANPEVAKQWSIEKLGLCLESTSMAQILREYDMLFNTLPDNYLSKTDRASMANSLEIRCPFLDYRIAEFSQRVPIEWEVGLFRSKKLMRSIIKDTVPPEIVRRKKHGFGTPLLEWILDEKYHDYLMQSLRYLRILSPEMYAFFRRRALIENDRLYRLYRARLLLFGKWVERWITDTA